MADGHAPAPEGHNGPPAELDPFEAIKINCDDLYDRAKPWLTGAAITTDAQGEEVEALLEDARDAFDAAEEQRKAEVKPLDDAKKAIQEKFHPLIGDTKAGKGSMVRLKAVCLAVLDPWRKKKAAEAEAAALAAQKLAAEQAEAAARAAREASGDLEATEEAEALVKEAAQAQRDANRATKAATTGTGLTTVWVATLKPEEGSFRAALIHYMHEQPMAFRSLVQQLADADARSGRHNVPGYDITPEKRAR